jgi:hypothetical protein
LRADEEGRILQATSKTNRVVHNLSAGKICDYRREIPIEGGTETPHAILANRSSFRGRSNPMRLDPVNGVTWHQGARAPYRTPDLRLTPVRYGHVDNSQRQGRTFYVAAGDGSTRIIAYTLLATMARLQGKGAEAVQLQPTCRTTPSKCCGHRYARCWVPTSTRIFRCAQIA